MARLYRSMGRSHTQNQPKIKAFFVAVVTMPAGECKVHSSETDKPQRTPRIP